MEPQAPTITVKWGKLTLRVAHSGDAMTVAQLCAALTTSHGAPPASQQKLIAKGKTLQPPSSTLVALKVKAGSKVMLMAAAAAAAAAAAEEGKAARPLGASAAAEPAAAAKAAITTAYGPGAADLRAATLSVANGAQTLVVAVEAGMTGEELRAVVAGLSGVAAAHVELVCKGRKLGDGPLSDAKVKAGSKLMLLRGAGHAALEATLKELGRDELLLAECSQRLAAARRAASHGSAGAAALSLASTEAAEAAQTVAANVAACEGKGVAETKLRALLARLAEGATALAAAAKR